MKILHVIPSLDLLLGGSVAACISACRDLARRGHEVFIYTGFDEFSGQRCAQNPFPNGEVQVRYFDVHHKLYGFSAPLFSALYSDVPSFEVVKIHGVYRFHFVAASIAALRSGVPYIVEPHSALDPFNFRVRRWRKRIPEALLIGPFLKRAAAVHFTAEEEMVLASASGLFENGNGQAVRNGVVIPYVFDPSELDLSARAEDFLDQHPELRNKAIVLFLSRINFKKGLDILAGAFGLVAKRHSNARLVIAGPDNEGYTNRVKDWLARAGVLDRTIFTGMLHGKAKVAAYRAASVFVLPSYSENFGLVVAEAMVCRAPVVISNRVNIWREVEAERAGIVVECDFSQVADAICRILESRDVAEDLRDRGTALIGERFNQKRVGDQMEALYRQLAARKAPL